MQGCWLGEKRRVYDRLARHFQSEKHIAYSRSIYTILVARQLGWKFQQEAPRNSTTTMKVELLMQE